MCTGFGLPTNYSPLLEWSDAIAWHSGASHDTLYFTDGKPWKMCRPGRGDTAAALLARAVGGADVNLIQQAYYNGHYGFCGAKVQHGLQADGMCHSFICPLRRHEAAVLQSSSIPCYQLYMWTMTPHVRSKHALTKHMAAPVTLDLCIQILSCN